MSPWEIIGWTIAIPMALMAGLFVVAVVFSVLRTIFKPRKPSPKHPAGRHLRLVEDD
jgi:uncharacterized membrane protein YfcA